MSKEETVMRVWTIQPEGVYERLREQGTLYTDISLSPLYGSVDGTEDGPVCHTLRTAYGWLTERMEEKIGKPEGASYPWWAWHTRKGRHAKPDLREAGYGQRGERLVCLELELPEGEVVLSDFDLWGFCVSGFQIPGVPEGSGEEANEEEARYRVLAQKEQERVKQESWEAVFGVMPEAGADIWIQATFWELRLAEARKAVYFTAR